MVSAQCRNGIVIAVVAFAAAFNVAKAQEAADSIPSYDLDELVVTASPVVENATGYRIRLAGQKIAKGKNTQELLGFLPNVSVENKTVKINGIGASEIRIDGRKISSIEELTNLPGEYIESVKVRFIAGADRLSDEKGGIIDITLRTVPPKGYFGSVNGELTASRASGMQNESLGGMIMARLGRLSIYESPQVGWMNFREKVNEEYLLPDSREYFNHKDITRSRRLSNYLCLNYELAPKHNLGLNWYVSYGRTHDKIKDIDGRPMLMRSGSKAFSNTVSMLYRGVLNDAGDRLNISAEWLNRNYHQDQTHFDAGAETGFEAVRQVANLYEFRANWSHSFSDYHEIEAGVLYKANTVKSDERQAWPGETPYAPVTPSVFTQTPLPYVEAQGRLWRINYYAGLNWQLNYVKATGEKAYTQNAVNPTVQLSLPFGSGNRHNINLIYCHELDRVPYDAITARQTWFGPNSYHVGNRDLKAPTEHYVSAVLGLWRRKLNITAAYMRDFNNIVWQAFTEPTGDIYYTKAVNVGAMNFYTLGAELTQNILSCWTLKATARLSFNSENATFDGVRYDGTRMRQYYRLQNSFNFPKGWGGTVSAYVEPTFKTYQRTYHTVYQVDLSVYKMFMGDRLQLQLDIRPCEKRRRLTYVTPGKTIKTSYSTPCSGRA